MKKTYIKIGIYCVSALFLFTSGFFIGLKSWDLSFPEITNLSIATVDLIPLQLHIEQLDRDDKKALRESLCLELDSQIIKTYQLLTESKDEQQIKKTREMLKRISNYRIIYPATYPGELEKMEQEQIRSQVGQILSKF